MKNALPIVALMLLMGFCGSVIMVQVPVQYIPAVSGFTGFIIGCLFIIALFSIGDSKNN